MMNDKEIDQAAELARTLLILNNYEWIRAQAASIGIDIIPLKGIDLLQNLYSERLDRHVNDIDILCFNEEDCRKLVNLLCIEEYRVEFPFALQPEALSSKRKVSLLSCSTTKVNVDVHTSFVTKKFFSQTIGSFNADALERCNNGYMEDLDRWLFLAQHAAFHQYADDKWITDLKLLYNRFNDEEKAAMVNRANRYGFRRVMAAALYQINKDNVEAMDHELRILNLNSPERKFLSFIKHFDRPFSRKPFDKFVAAYWEFTFISDWREQMKAWLHLVFPSRGMLTNIYRIKKPSSLLLFYPLNFSIAGLSSVLFGLLYTFVIVKKRLSL